MAARPYITARSARLPWATAKRAMSKGLLASIVSFVSVTLARRSALRLRQPPRPPSPYLIRANSAAQAPCVRRDQPGWQGCIGRLKGSRIRCIRLTPT